MLRAEQGNFAAGFPERRPLRAALVEARPAAGIDHASFGVLGAKLRLVALMFVLVCESCSLFARFVTAPQLSDVDHPIFGVPGAELHCLASVNSIGCPRDAVRVATLDHPSTRAVMFCLSTRFCLSGWGCCAPGAIMCTDSDKMFPSIRKPFILYRTPFRFSCLLQARLSKEQTRDGFQPPRQR